MLSPLRREFAGAMRKRQSLNNEDPFTFLKMEGAFQQNRMWRYDPNDPQTSMILNDPLSRTDRATKIPIKELMSAVTQNQPRRVE